MAQELFLGFEEYGSPDRVTHICTEQNPDKEIVATHNGCSLLNIFTTSAMQFDGGNKCT
jgi:hypothetical protein